MHKAGDGTIQLSPWFSDGSVGGDTTGDHQVRQCRVRILRGADRIFGASDQTVGDGGLERGRDIGDVFVIRYMT